MVKKVESYQSASGKLFLSEESAVRHDALERICEVVPELALIRARIEGNLDALAGALEPLVRYHRGENHPETTLKDHPETTPLSDLRAAAIGEMQAMGAPARDWLTRNGFANVKEFVDVATRSDVDKWRGFVGEVAGVKQVYIDGEPVAVDIPAPLSHDFWDAQRIRAAANG